MKTIYDMKITKYSEASNRLLKEGFTGKVLMDEDRHFEGIVRDDNSKFKDCFIFGQMDENGNIDCYKTVFDSSEQFVHIQAGRTKTIYEGTYLVYNRDNSYPLETDSRVLVFLNPYDKTRDFSEEEQNNLEQMVAQGKSLLGETFGEVYLQHGGKVYEKNRNN